MYRKLYFVSLALLGTCPRLRIPQRFKSCQVASIPDAPRNSYAFLKFFRFFNSCRFADLWIETCNTLYSGNMSSCMDNLESLVDCISKFLSNYILKSLKMGLHHEFVEMSRAMEYQNLWSLLLLWYNNLSVHLLMLLLPLNFYKHESS